MFGIRFGVCGGGVNMCGGNGVYMLWGGECV